MRSDCYIVFLVLLLPLSLVEHANPVSPSGYWRATGLFSSSSLETELAVEYPQVFDYTSRSAADMGTAEPASKVVFALSDYPQQRTGSFAWIILIGVLASLVWWVYLRYQQLAIRQDALFNEVSVLRQQMLAQSNSKPTENSSLSVDRTKVERSIDGRLGESAWRIINLVLENPAISNKEIASEMNLSLDGVSSALRRIYAAFGVKGKGNKKVLLSRKILQISTGIDELNKEQ